jgi:hypothetical protein
MTCRLAVVAILVFGAACSSNPSPTGPSVPLDQRFTLAPSETALISSAGFSVQFVSVAGDSRCPADALCIQGGDAVVTLRVRDSGNATATYDLHTGDSARAAAKHRDFRVELVELQPYPFSSRPTTPADYRVTLRVTR